MNSKNYPNWIDEYTKAFYNGFLHMTPCSWGPMDFYAILGFLNGAFISKLHEAIIRIKQQNIPIAEVAKSFTSPSGFRISIYYAIIEYQFSNPKNKEQFKESLDFLLDILRCLIKKDVFAYESNIAHTQREIATILDIVPWTVGNPIEARELGKLYNSLASLVFALYRDFFPQDSNEIYGPYDVSAKFGNGAMLVIKHFSKIRPVELWPQMGEEKYSEVKIFQVYKNVIFKCELIGMHSIYDGDLINNLVAYAVMVDGKFVNNTSEIKRLRDYFAEIAIEQSAIYRGLSREELKRKFLEWYCYQFVNFFKLANMDWIPTQQMLEAVKGKEVADRFELVNTPTYEEYATSLDFEVYWLKDLYKNSP